ncbi:MAG: DUF2461 domain-containing protein [Caldilineales bacterium]
MMFEGFPPAGLMFLADLAQNNDREWFEAHRDEYQKELLEPAQAFVAALGERLREFAPHVQFDTKTNGTGSLMRIHRDVRFSKDKSPYHEYVSGLLWEGKGKKNECPAFGFQLTPFALGLMAGQFMFTRDGLIAYRAAVLNDESGPRLAAILDDLRSRPGYEVGGVALKKVPRGFNSDHPRAELLRFKGLYTHPPRLEGPILSSPELVEVCMLHFAAMAPLQQWLVEATQ